MRRRSSFVLGSALAALFAFAPVRAGAEGGSFSDAEVLGKKPDVHVELVQTRVSAYEQTGRGYQSQAGPLQGPGSASS